MTDDGPNDAPTLSCANIGIAVEGTSDATRGAADIILTESGLSTIAHVIHGSRIIFQHMRNYLVYACTVTIHIVIFFAPCLRLQVQLPLFMVLAIALLNNNGTIMTLSVDRLHGFFSMECPSVTLFIAF